MAVAGTGKIAAVSAVVIGGNEEDRIRIDRLAVKGQVLNALRLRIDALALAVIARWLGDINLVLPAVDNDGVKYQIDVPQPARYDGECQSINPKASPLCRLLSPPPAYWGRGRDRQRYGK